MKGALRIIDFEDDDMRIASFRQIAYGNTESDLTKCDECFIYELLDSISNLKWLLKPNKNLFVEQLN